MFAWWEIKTEFKRELIYYHVVQNLFVFLPAVNKIKYLIKKIIMLPAALYG